MDNIPQKQNKASMEYEHKQLGTYGKDVKNVEDAKFNYHAVNPWWLSLGATTNEVMYNCWNRRRHGIINIDIGEVTWSL